MFRISAATAHTWQDFAKNVGKLSLAGLFLGGSFFLANARAAEIAQSIPTHQHTISVAASAPIPESN